MLGRDPIEIDDERGSTLVELLVGMAAGMVVLAGLSMLLITVLHGNGRVDARIEATDNARLAVTRIMEQLHSACTSVRVAPVKKESSGTKLIFTHGKSKLEGEVAPEAVQTTIAYQPVAGTIGGTLTQTEAGETRTLLTNVAPAGTEGVFNYFYSQGAGPKSFERHGSPLSEAEAKKVIQVEVALTAAPRSTPVADSGANATIQDSATLRLTPPSYTETEVPPCE